MELRFLPMLTRRKLVYKVTYPNGKIYVGVELISTSVSYFGSPSQKAVVGTRAPRKIAGAGVDRRLR